MRNRSTVLVLLAALGAAGSGCATALSAQTRNEISIQMASIQPGLKGCYEQGLTRDEGMNGTLELSFVVAPDGQFGNVQAAGGSLGDAEVKQCIVQQVAALRVATPPARPTVVSYPLAFQPEPIP